MNYVMNEKKLAEKILGGTGYGDSYLYTSSILAKYYKSLGYGNDEIKANLECLIDERVPSVKSQTKKDWIKKALKISDKYPLYETNKIFISKTEIEKIKSIHSDKFRDPTIQKAAFTLVCFAKFLAERGSCDGWINTDIKNIFTAAGIKIKIERQQLLLHELYKSGFVAVNPIVGKFCVRVLFVDNGETELEVDNINESGLIFDEYNGRKIVKCQMCGKRFPLARNGRSIFCKDCAVERNRLLTRERHRTKRERIKGSA